MKNSKTLTILIPVLALMLCPVSTALGAVSLTVNGQDVTSITLELGQMCTVEVVSDDSSPYNAYVGFDEAVVLGSFDQPLVMPEAGDLASITEYNVEAFYGYYVSAAGTSPPPSPGVHFVIEYEPQQVGETDIKLYDSSPMTVITTVHITVVDSDMVTAFTYQGRLMEDDNPADGQHDFEFMLYDAPSYGSQLAGTVEVNDMDVINGYFTVELDFGSDVFDGDARWLEISVRPGDMNDPNAYTTLNPRQEVTPVPYALQTRGIFVDDAGNVGIGTSAPSAKLDVETASEQGGAATIGSSTNSAAGDCAVAMGLGTTAGGGASTAMGNNTTAGGGSSTAMGNRTTAGGGSSTAMGYNTTANGFNSTSMGNGTTAGGDNSTAMGAGTTASGWASTAMGHGIEAAGQYSVAIALSDQTDVAVTQDNTMAILGGNVGIGTTTPAKKLTIQETRPRLALVENGGDAAVLEFHEQENQLRLQHWTDYGSTFHSSMMTLDGDTGNVGIGTDTPGAKLDVETAFGQGGAATIGSATNSATGDYAVAMGYNTTAGGGASTAMGIGTTAGGGSSTAMGYGTTAGGNYSTAMGAGTTAGGINSTAMGSNTTAIGQYSTAMGNGTTAVGGSSTAMGRETTARGGASTAMGYGIEAAGDYSVAIALNDQRGTVVTQPNTMAIMGGNVGIGTTAPGAKLDVDGDLKVSGAYKGDIGPNHGAPFPRPAYDSGWQAISKSDVLTLTHNVGGDVNRYVVDMQMYSDSYGYGIHNFRHGGDSYDGNHYGAYYRELTTSSIKINRRTDDFWTEQVRIRIWVYN